MWDDWYTGVHISHGFRLQIGQKQIGRVARRRIGVIHLHREDECSKSKICSNQIVQKFGLAQSRIGWRRGDCMNRLVCRRRIGVIHLHRDDRFCPLSDIYSLSRARLTRERPAKAIPSIISDRQILSPASQYDVGTSLSLATNVNVTAASVSPTLRLCS